MPNVFEDQESRYDGCSFQSFPKLCTNLEIVNTSSSRSSSSFFSSSSFLELSYHQPRMSVKISFHLRVDQISLVSSVPLSLLVTTPFSRSFFIFSLTFFCIILSFPWTRINCRTNLRDSFNEVFLFSWGESRGFK